MNLSVFGVGLSVGGGVKERNGCLGALWFGFLGGAGVLRVLHENRDIDRSRRSTQSLALFTHAVRALPVCLGVPGLGKLGQLCFGALCYLPCSVDQGR